jgi:hypothetical protein
MITVSIWPPKLHFIALSSTVTDIKYVQLQQTDVECIGIWVSLIQAHRNEERDVARQF